MYQQPNMDNSKERQTRRQPWLQDKPKKTKQATPSQKQRNFESKQKIRMKLRQANQGPLPPRRRFPQRKIKVELVE
jgi:hypothetical protein